MSKKMKIDPIDGQNLSMEAINDEILAKAHLFEQTINPNQAYRI